MNDPLTSGPAESGSGSSGRGRTFFRLLIRWPGVLVPVLLVVLIGVLLAVSLPGEEAGGKGPSVLNPAAERIEVQVLNGSGEKYLARRVTEFLRARGFDVVEMGNANRQDYAQTLVVDRSGREDRARLVAAALGLPSQRVERRLDPSLYLDVTVVLGKDYPTLVPFGSHTIQEEPR